MLLPAGITGFYNSPKTKPPSLSIKEVKRQCYSLMQAANGELISFEKASYPRNFFIVKVRLSETELFVLVNEHYPFVAFATSLENGNIAFTDYPLITDVYSTYFNVLTKKELLSPITLGANGLVTKLDFKSELTEVELEQILHWEPDTLGQIIFNEWD